MAATREIVGATTDVKRFWPVSDERGLIYRMLDEDGATHWQAHWDATAWRSLDGTPQQDMWVPFGLAGQILLEHTEASPGQGAASVRPAIVINQLRAYDPFPGSFLQPDPADQSPRLLPEGYLFARGEYLAHSDESGEKSNIREQYNRLIPPGWELRFDASCADRKQELLAAINEAITEIDRCPLEKCDAAGFAPNLKKQWIFALLTGRNYCVKPNGSVQTPIYQAPTRANKKGDVLVSLKSEAFALMRMDPGTTLGARITVFGTSSPCLKRSVAHEAMHGVMKTLPMPQVSAYDEIPLERHVGELYYGKALCANVT
ncbi:MAG TPA: hypothetical protein VFT22_21500 [Kofleriaceae bacterium]|nr:hypothetical protein [Kofleriaceae bacterium]